MHAYAYPSRQEKVISGAFAFGMHLVFLALLVFGVTWPKRIEPQANIVDLWANLPSPAPPKVEPPRPRPELKPEVKPPEPPPVKPVAKPEIPKPDIAMKEKAMKEKVEKEKAEKEKAEKDRRVLEEKQKEAKKREAEAKAAQKLQREKEAEAQRLAREQEDAQRRIAEQQASAQARLRNEYIERIRSRIKRFVVMPPNMQGNPEAEFDVVLLPGGEVLSVKLKRASGNAAYDSAVERAIHKAAPLPLPPDPALFRDFRELNLKFRSQE
ncbi:MAG: cell envelope integrity protein TolA [Betaproteobacteria bacterium]|nr:cell envelope integrity protein TolA [Betaproteobacteria bacterium]